MCKSIYLKKVPDVDGQLSLPVDVLIEIAELQATEPRHDREEDSINQEIDEQFRRLRNWQDSTC